MHTMLPNEARVDVDAVDLSDNLVGLVEGVHAIMSYVLADELPAEFGVDELLCVSGAALKNYVYEPGYNRSSEPRAFSRLGELVCNYGPFESLSYFTGWDVKEFDGISRDDFWKLLQYEVASGRPVLTLGVEGPLGPVLVSGYHNEPRHQTLDVIRAGQSDVETVDLSGVRDVQAGEPSFSNWLVIARPGEQPDWVTSRTRQRLSALRWAASHARSQKEFSHETRENYAPGLRGFQAFLGIVDAFLESGEAPRAVDSEWARYVSSHVDGLVHGRRAASRRLPDWAKDFGASEELEVADAAAVEASLQAAADAYGRVGDVLQSWQRGQSDDELIGEDLKGLRQAYEEAYEAEGDAVRALEEALAGLPKGL
jgi:hypothetical protein